MLTRSLAEAPPVVSVIVPTKNRAGSVVELIAKIEEQRGVSFELIVVDDGSSFEHRAVVKARLEQSWLPSKWLEHGQTDGLEMTGPAAARNRGISVAEGEFLAFCDDDDLWTRPEHLAVAVSVLSATRATLYLADMRGTSDSVVTIPSWYADCASILERARALDGAVGLRVLSRALMCEWIVRTPIHLNTLVVHRARASLAGRLWEQLRFFEDTEWVLRLIDAGGDTVFDQAVAADFNVTPHQRLFEESAVADRSCIVVAAMNRVASIAKHREVRRAAERIESWALRSLARKMESRAYRRSAAVKFLQALCSSATLGGVVDAVRTMLKLSKSR